MALEVDLIQRKKAIVDRWYGGIGHTSEIDRDPISLNRRHRAIDIGGIADNVESAISAGLGVGDPVSTGFVGPAVDVQVLLIECQCGGGSITDQVRVNLKLDDRSNFVGNAVADRVASAGKDGEIGDGDAHDT